MNLNGCEIDGVPAPSDWELCPDGLDRERAISRLRACIRQNLAVIAERDGYRAVAEQRAAEVERLREENGQIADLCDGTLSTNAELAAKVERLRVVLAEAQAFVGNWCASIGSTEWGEYMEGKRVKALIAAALAPHEVEE